MGKYINQRSYCSTKQSSFLFLMSGPINILYFQKLVTQSTQCIDFHRSRVMQNIEENTSGRSLFLCCPSTDKNQNSVYFKVDTTEKNNQEYPEWFISRFCANVPGRATKGDSTLHPHGGPGFGLTQHWLLQPSAK